jgi:ribonuclease HI
MSPERIVRCLAERYEKKQIKICSPTHVQVLTSKGPHNIWPTTHKYQLAGKVKVSRFRNVKHLLGILGSHSYDETDLARMEKALEITEVIKLAKEINKDCIFVDAGHNPRSNNNPNSRYGIVIILGERIIAESDVFYSKDNNEAERTAIIKAHQKRWSMHLTSLPIFSDNKSVVQSLTDKNYPNIHWICREKNPSDKIGNMRKKPKSHRNNV